ncbi:MAG: hypothetical protein WCR19_00200 [Acholeplasmataceae bacterium]
MALFNIHFFKEKSRQIDLEQLITFLENIEGFKVEMDEKSVRFNYTHPRLNYKVLFMITPKSQVPDIYRLNPKFLDLNFHLELPILTPNYIASQVFEIVKKICDRFNFAIYNEMFENVLTFKMDTVFKVFTMLKDAYIEKNPIILNDYYYVATDKLYVIYRYLDDYLELQKYYQELDTYVPKYHFLSTNNKKLALGIEWKENSLTVFPIDLDYIFYRSDNHISVYSAAKVFELIEKYLSDVPGFIKGTKVITKQVNKKIHKLVKKAKLEDLKDQFKRVELRYMID